MTIEEAKQLIISENLVLGSIKHYNPIILNIEYNDIDKVFTAFCDIYKNGIKGTAICRITMYDVESYILRKKLNEYNLN